MSSGADHSDGVNEVDGTVLPGAALAPACHQGTKGSIGLGSTVRVCPGGPLLVRGAATVTTPDGRELPVRRPVIALCRCGCSGLAPYCDGTHKLLRPARESTGDPDAGIARWLFAPAPGQ